MDTKKLLYLKTMEDSWWTGRVLCKNVGGFLLFTYSFINHQAPGFAAERISSQKFKRIEKKVSHGVIQPDDACPAPSNVSDSSKTPVCCGRYHSCNLKIYGMSRRISNYHISM